MELVNITYLGEGFQSQDLTPLDRQLVSSNFINSQFGAEEDYIELYIYDENNNLLQVDYDAFDYYPYLTANPKNNTYSALTLDPEKDLKNRGYYRGNLNTQYNFYKRLFNSAFGTYYWIKEISPSRTELKLASQTISDDSILDGFSQYQSYISNKNYYPIFYLNFGNNQTIIASNVSYTEDEDGSYLLIKLYEPLDADFDLKSQLWIVDKVAESVSYNVSITVEAENIDQANRLRGPNFNVQINDKNGQTTPYYNYNNLLASPVSSSFQKLLSYYQDRSVAINIDYSDFSNFIHFSSATERVSNFIYKVGLIEQYQQQQYNQSIIAGGSANSSYKANSIDSAQQAIDNIIEKFDTYEYFLYFNSSSWAWPKINTTQPYQLYSVTSSQVSNFLGSINTVPTATTQSLLFSASYYDSTNKDLLHNSIPQYLLDDANNQPFITFMDMIGQHFDNIWIYYKDLSNRYNATNNPDTGISLDVVGDALRGLGIQLYTNSNVSDNLYYTLFGINPDGTLLPPTGSEKITAIGGKYVTSSLETLSAKEIQQELYKRLYHNLPYLLKSKGTERGIKALISTFGIPDDILTVREFGGTPINSVDGVFDLDSSTYKVAIVTGSGGNVTGSLTLSSSLLHPEASLQYYQNINRINTTNIEVGFSPADTINKNIVTSEGYFNIDQLIGSPGYQYSASYTPLVNFNETYFSSYTQKNSIWEYIRLIKFYNNSLFKMIKDYVPARANLSTGIIVKSHMLERNKYARHEPSASFNDYSQSIDTAFITGSSAGAVIGSTSFTGSIMTPFGSVEFISSDGIEKYTGEFSGSTIVATSGEAFPQFEISQLPSSSLFLTYSFGALYQNVTQSVRSQILFDLDYNSDQIKPVNYGLVTQSINEAQIDNYASYTNPTNPYAYVQDYNYNLKRSLIPRYSGSHIQSAKYNIFTPGDVSYGKTATIDKINYQYAYLLDIYGASIYLPGRSNAQIKYLIDNDENVLDLTKTNQNIFSVQNVFKSGQTADVSLFEYDEKNPYSQQLVNNPTLQIFEGGFRYLPILHNVSGSSANNQTYTLTTAAIERISVSSPAVPGDLVLDETNWTVEWYTTEIPTGELCVDGSGGTSNYSVALRVVYNGEASVPYNVSATINTIVDANGFCTTEPPVVRQFGARLNTGQSSKITAEVFSVTTQATCTPGGGSYVGLPPGYDYILGCVQPFVSQVSALGGGGSEPTPGSSTFFEYYTTQVTGSPCLYFISESNQLVFNGTISYYYNTNGLTFNSKSDLAWTSSLLDDVILPFTLNVGDRISLYDSASRLAWDERFEYVVKNTSITGSFSSISSSRLLVELDRPANLALFITGSTIPVDAITNAPWRACRYIVWKHIPDETNVMLRYNPKDSNILENGILFPEYIDETARDNSGNVIKALKQQNLIDPDTNTIIFQ
jgi:hypothetical protein